MNALRHSPWLWTTCRKTLCAIGLAALAGSALADEVVAMNAKVTPTVRAEIPAVKNRKAAVWTAPALPMSWNRIGQPDEWSADDSYMSSMDNFDTGRLFRTRKELLYQDTLRLLLTKRQVRVWLRDNLHLQCEVKRWHTIDDGRELGLKLGVYYRFD